MTFKEIMQDIVCSTPTTEWVVDNISYLFCSRIGRIKDEYYTEYSKKRGSQIGIIQPNFFFDTYMFKPKDKDYSYPICRDHIEKLN